MTTIATNTLSPYGYEFLLNVKKNNLEEAKLILSKDLSALNYVDEFGSNALIEAILLREETFACELIKLGINVDIIDKLGRTPESLSNRIGLFNVIEKINNIRLKKAGLNFPDNYENPFSKLQHQNFSSSEIPLLYAFPVLKNCSSIIDSSKIRSFICFYKSELLAKKNYNLINPMSRNISEFTKHYTEIIIVDLLEIPFNETTYDIPERTNYIKTLYNEDCYKIRKQEFDYFNITYFADYSVEHLSEKIKEHCKNL
jgi:hypothetical protein